MSATFNFINISKSEEININKNAYSVLIKIIPPRTTTYFYRSTEIIYLDQNNFVINMFNEIISQKNTKESDLFINFLESIWEDVKSEEIKSNVYNSSQRGLVVFKITKNGESVTVLYSLPQNSNNMKDNVCECGFLANTDAIKLTESIQRQIPSELSQKILSLHDLICLHIYMSRNVRIPRERNNQLIIKDKLIDYIDSGE